MKWRHVHCRCHDFRFYVTLFPKCFSNFRSRYLFAIGLPTLYFTLADTYLPLHTAFPSSATLLILSMRLRFLAQRANTDLGLKTPLRGCIQRCLLYQIEFHQSDKPTINSYFATTERPLRPHSATSPVPLRSPLTEGITVVFFSSAE